MCDHENNVNWRTWHKHKVDFFPKEIRLGLAFRVALMQHESLFAEILIQRIACNATAHACESSN